MAAITRNDKKGCRDSTIKDRDLQQKLNTSKFFFWQYFWMK